MQNISLNTAKSCYELLEAQGLIYVKEKSGYFVNRNKKPHRSLYLTIQILSREAREVSNLDLQIKFMRLRSIIS
jgi:DNA-binding transcriptional regulator YhcF (GntR family)